MGPGTSPQSDSVLCLLRRPEFWATPRSSPYKTYGGPWRTVTEISVTVDHFPLAPSLRVAGSPHLVLSTQIFLGDLSASVGILGRPNSRSLAAGASPGTPKNRACPWTLGHKHSSSLYSNILTKSLEMENTMYRLPISLRVLYKFFSFFHGKKVTMTKFYLWYI